MKTKLNKWDASTSTFCFELLRLHLKATFDDVMKSDDITEREKEISASVLTNVFINFSHNLNEVMSEQLKNEEE